MVQPQRKRGMGNSISHEQRTEIANFAGTFMRDQFGFQPDSILQFQTVNVLMDTDFVTIRVDNFLCRAEQSMRGKNANLIQEMYSEIYCKGKSILEDRVHQITCKEVISSQISINFETKKCVLLIFLASDSTHSKDEVD